MKTLILSCVFYLYTFQQQLQTHPIQNTFTLARRLVIELTLDKPLAPHTVPGAVKVQYFHLCTAAINEDKQLTAERVFMQPMFDHCG